MPGLQFVADIMNRGDQRALTEALGDFLHSEWRDEIWPASRHLQLDDVDLVVLPLQRVGAPLGQSGASVFVAYYRARENVALELQRSAPLAVKIDQKQKMKDELARADGLRDLDEMTEARLVKPFDCLDCKPGSDDDRAILVARFRSGVPGDVKVSDLWAVLQSPDWLHDSAHGRLRRRAFGCLGGALDVVSGLHRAGGSTRQTRSYATALEWYLRQTRDPAESKGSHAYIPRSIFGDAQTVRVFGRKWINPTHVIDRFLCPARTFKTTIGTIHGDLHPKNIVLDESDEPHIIDFGWTREDAPVVLDYILLDINLRSITLPSQVEESDLLKIARFLPGARRPTGLRRCAQARVDLIREAIWKRLEERRVVRDWLEEYVIPFFMVAYGLLRHLDAARNQMALVATVLAAAKHIDRATRD